MTSTTQNKTTLERNDEFRAKTDHARNAIGFFKYVSNSIILKDESSKSEGGIVVVATQGRNDFDNGLKETYAVKTSSVVLFAAP